ncbi:hypothetical protein J7E62_31885 [Variovorax paradoxus]|nr:hypothetical protein [Variovorax paradoxus]
MNISPARDHADPPAAPPDWTIEVGSETVGEGIYFFADVKRAGKVMFRVGIGGVSDEAKAKKLLATKAREWIDEFLIREQQSGASSQDN